MNTETAFLEYRRRNASRVDIVEYHTIGENYGVVSYVYKRMDPPDPDTYYQPVRLEENGFSEEHEVTKSFDYAVILAIAFAHGRQGYAPAVRRLLLDK